MRQVLREIVAEIEKQAMAIVVLEAESKGQDARLALELTASAMKRQYDNLRKRIDALP